MSQSEFEPMKRCKKSRKKMYSSSPNASFNSVISEPKTANAWHELNVAENKQNKSLTKELYLNAQQFFFSTNDDQTNFKLTCFIETKAASLLIATDHGQIGILDRTETEARWLAITRAHPIDLNLDPRDCMYDEDRKLLIDLCIDNLGQLIVMTKFIFEDLRRSNEFAIEVYSLNEARLEIKLTKTFDLSRIISRHLANNQSPEFVKIAYDSSSDLFVLIEENNHKIYWCSPFSFNAKKAISSPDSIIKPNSIAIIQDFGFYLASLKGIVLRQNNQDAVLHDVPVDSAPLDIIFSSQDQNIYFIDKFNLYRSKLADSKNNQLRYKRIFSNEKLDNENGFSRVIRNNEWFYLMVKDSKCVICLNAKDLL